MLFVKNFVFNAEKCGTLPISYESFYDAVTLWKKRNLTHRNACI